MPKSRQVNGVNGVLKGEHQDQIPASAHVINQHVVLRMWEGERDGVTHTCRSTAHLVHAAWRTRADDTSCRQWPCQPHRPIHRHVEPQLRQVLSSQVEIDEGQAVSCCL
jgi:hypothetical protein